MSRAFVKEADEAPPELPDRQISPHPNYVTAHGLALIEAEAERFSAALAEAQAAEDREGVAAASRELRYWTQRRMSAEVQPPPADNDIVRFGSRVTIERDDGREQTFQIVGEDEADPAKGTLSYVSPLAHALLEKSVGDVVTVGRGGAEIVKIEIGE
jgi:transcription elongation GreA/GreB family factor